MSPDGASQLLKDIHVQAPRFFLVACVVCLCYWFWDEDLHGRESVYYNVSLPSTGIQPPFPGETNFTDFHNTGSGTIQIVEQIKNGTYTNGPFNSSELVAPFIRYRETFQVAPAYNLSSCQIEKVMTTISGSIFCYITNTSEFVAQKRRISTETYTTRLCLNQNSYENFTAVQEVLGASKTEYTIVRDPISRFLSGFVNKCIEEGRYSKERCFACEGDMACFVEQLYFLMMLAQTGEFTKFHYELAHFSPQTWYCNFKQHLYNYKILRYKEGKDGVAELSHELDAIYRTAHVPEEIRQEIHKELCFGKTYHTTSGTAEMRKAHGILMNNKTLLTTVIRMYYYDFIVFNFTLPVPVSS
ncbi:hypothetical protein Y032_0010g1124 [Ancylostoma ceylanicum]|nr:hypothetical protein Y032_0010g1124 [Ancylostoma ceylanicum]